ncbi:LamG-like jellyroll fold domain-containing protein [Sphingobacterium faecium]|uniref:LamG-like jellyroll fold domain-containing protein n=1 Tax=Sphingobacterium faecium TaxID=34087 RepID=UPI003209C176
MKRNKKSRVGIRVLGCILFMGALFMNGACNKDFINSLPDSSKNDTLGVGDGSKRVLYLILDGVKGSVIQELAPKNLTQITLRSIYTYDGVADYNYHPYTQAAAWTTMLTGVDYTKHQVTSSSFEEFNNAATPTIFTRIKDELKNARTVSFTSNSEINVNLAKDATETKTLANDADVKKALVQELTTGNASLLVGQFDAAALAGGSDFSASNSAYVAAIQTLDNYIGEILEALKARKTYEGENWMIVIASSRGGGLSGGESGSNIYADGSRNAFYAFYNPKFTSNKYDKPQMDALPYVGTTQRYQGANSRAEQRNADLANFGADQDATIRFNIRWDQGSTIYPAFVSKRASFSGGVVGWLFFMESGGTVGINLSQVGQVNTQRVHTRNIADGIWHNITAKFWKNGTTRYLTLFIDGIPAPGGDLNITNLGNLNTSSPLRLGSIGDGNVNCLISDFAIYNMALPNDVIIAKSKTTPLNEENDAYYNKLTGYWKCNEGEGEVLNDVTGKSTPFYIQNKINWVNFSDFSPNITPTISQSIFKVVPNGVDIPVMIYNWMNISVPKNWGLMGKFYNPSFNLPRD